MKPLNLFASEQFPLRASALQTLAKCPYQMVLKFLEQTPDESGAAADTGSSVHVAAEVFHRTGDFARAVAEMRRIAPQKFPRADIDAAEKLASAYCRDPRNARATIETIECPIRFSIDPHPTDPTGKPIWIMGTLDQIRAERGGSYLWDLKTGKYYDGLEQLYEATLQLSAYCVGATAKFGRNILPGGVIKPAHYLKRGVDPTAEPPGIFWHASFTLADCYTLVDGLRHVIAGIRRGEVPITPGSHCTFCPTGGLDACIPILRRLIGS